MIEIPRITEGQKEINGARYLQHWPIIYNKLDNRFYIIIKRGYVSWKLSWYRSINYKQKQGV